MRERQDELPPAVPHDGASSHVTAAADLQTNLAQVIRHARLPQVHRRVMSDSRVFIDRSIYATLFNVDVLGHPSLSELAAEMLLDISTVSRHVRRLVETGLAERAPHPDDRRVTMVSTTPEGHEVAARITRAWQAAFDQSLADWSAEELERVAAQLLRLAASLRTFTEG